MAEADEGENDDQSTVSSLTNVSTSEEENATSWNNSILPAFQAFINFVNNIVGYIKKLFSRENDNLRVSRVSIFRSEDETSSEFRSEDGRSSEYGSEDEGSSEFRSEDGRSSEYGSEDEGSSDDEDAKTTPAYHNGDPRHK